jgi:hypothetical protein
MFLRSSTLSALAAITVLVAGCGSAVQAPLGQQQALRQAAALGQVPAGPKTKADFVKACAAKGIKFSDDQLELIQKERRVVPSGVWAPRPAENLTGEQNLDVHWRKHGHEFRPAIESAEAYLAQGNAAGAGNRGEIRFFFDTTSLDKGYQSHVVRWNPKNHDFPAFRADGAETTYYQNDPKPSRFVEVPLW